jgi:hypothetical protein
VFGAPSCAIGLCGRLGLGLAALLALALLGLCDLSLVIASGGGVPRRSSCFTRDEGVWRHDG